jgi:hypothetical protein
MAEIEQPFGHTIFSMFQNLQMARPERLAEAVAQGVHASCILLLLRDHSGGSTHRGWATDKCKNQCGFLQGIA